MVNIVVVVVTGVVLIVEAVFVVLMMDGIVVHANRLRFGRERGSRDLSAVFYQLRSLKASLSISIFTSA
jgi:hypothetical protein